jgi:p-hydroxybenzoate 3-monooxygenase
VTRRRRTRVGIVGAGPAGLVLGHILHLQGIEAVVLEARSRQYVENRVRAGVLEQGTAELLVELGVGARLQREGIVHHGIELLFDGRGHRIAFDQLVGRGITIYGQQEIIKDLIAARLDANLPLLFEVEDVTLHDIETDSPTIRYRHRGQVEELRCDAVAGCDGYHGVSRDAVPPGVLSFRTREYPFGWFGILAQAPPAAAELIYAYHARGFALHSMRSPQLSRLYFQCDPTENADDWTDDRIWHELQLRLSRDDEDWSLNEGPIVEKGVTPMRSLVTEPMQYGRLYLAGDAVHIVPPTGAKGLNLAVADVRTLGEALMSWLRGGDGALLERYSAACLRHVWRTQHFAWWMTAMLHRFADDQNGFQAALQRAELEYVCSSRAAASTLAENYVGLTN